MRRARGAQREDFVRPGGYDTIRNTTQLIRAALLNNLPRVLQLVSWARSSTPLTCPTRSQR